MLELMNVFSVDDDCNLFLDRIARLLESVDSFS